MSTLNDTDLFVIERSGANYQVRNDEMSTLNDTDLFVVERAGTNYKVEAKDVGGGPSGYFDTPVEVLTPLNGAGLNAGESYEPTSSDLSSVVDLPGWNAAAATEATNWYGVTYGVDKFVAVAYAGTNRVMYSADGISWTAASAAENNGWYSVTYGADKFVAVAQTGTNRVMYSADGINWNSVAVEANNWRSVTYGDNKFVAVAAAAAGTNQVMYSADGINWTATSGTEDYSWCSVTYGGDKFVAVANSGTNRVMYSADGISWTTGTAAEANSWKSVTYGDGKFVAVASGGTNGVMYSADGISWTAASATEASDWQSVTYGDGKFVAVSGSGTNRVMYSANGINWTAATASEANYWLSVTYGDGKFVAVSDSGTNQVMWSVTGTDAFEALTFTDGTELANIIGPVRMVDENGDVKTPVTSAITSVTPVAGGSELTLTTNQDLKYLKAGDVVTAPGSTTQTAAFSTTLYTGNGDGSQTDNQTQFIPSSIDNTDKALVWIKSSSEADNNILINTISGGTKYLVSNESFSEADNLGLIQSFASDGFTLGSEQNVNNSGDDYVAWNFRAAPGFFDIVEYKGSRPLQQVPHSLGTAVGMMIIKNTDWDSGWAVYHKETGADYYFTLDSTTGATQDTEMFGNTVPTDTYFTVGGRDTTNKTDDDFVAYLFADTPGLIKCGGYPGNGSQVGPVINTGFSTGWLMIKRTDEARDWVIFDNTRTSGRALFPNKSNAEDPNTQVELTSTGFNIISDGSDTNNPNGTYIYVAIAVDATAGSLSTTGTLLADADPSAKTMQVDSSFSTGQILTGPALDTVSNNVVGQSGDTLSVTDTTGTWFPGLFAEGATITASAPSPESIVFTSMNDGTTPVTGLDVSLGRRVWTLESSDSKSGPWTVVGTYPDDAANASQDGATPWGNPPLEANTFYQVKVKYESANANAVESKIYNTFRTGDN